MDAVSNFVPDFLPSAARAAEAAPARTPTPIVDTDRGPALDGDRFTRADTPAVEAESFAPTLRQRLAVQIEQQFESVAVQRARFTDPNTGTRFSAINLSAVRERSVFGMRLDVTSGLFSASNSPIPDSLAQTINDQATRLAGADSRYLWDYLALIEHLSGDEDAVQNYVRQVESFLSSGDLSGLSDFNAEMQQSTGAPAGEGMAFQINLEISVSTERTTITMQRVDAQQQGQDPLVFDLDGDGIELAAAGAGAVYDLTGDGVAEATGTVTGGDAFLALDRNGNGRIDGGLELFGDQHGAADGFAELALYDANQDRVIDARDPIFSQLLLFRDDNGDGLSVRGELLTLAEAGIASISLDAFAIDTEVAGHRLTSAGSFTRTDGATGTVADAVFSVVA